MKEIKIVKVQEIETKKGNKFVVYKALDKEGKLMDVKFTKDVQVKPTKPSIIVVDEEQCNVAMSGLYPILWVKKIEEIKEEERKSNVDLFF